MIWRDNMNLEHMVLINVATQLWKDVHTSNDFQENFHIPDEKWDLLEDICLENINKLKLPNALKERIRKLIKPIGIEIVKFNHYRIGILPGNDCIKQKPIKLCWTMRGTVDTKRTFKALIDDQSIDLSFRYRLACHCCLEHDISVLWDRMSEELQFDLAPMQNSHLINIWYKLRKNQKPIREFACKNDFSELYEYAVSKSLEDYNKDAVEFFWKKLSAEKRSLQLPRYLEGIQYYTNSIKEQGRNSFHHVCDCTEVVLFLLTQADKGSLREVMSNPTYGFPLISLLDWPCQETFLEILDSFQLFVCSFQHGNILEYIVDKIYFGFQDYDYGQLLKLLLRQESKFQKQCDRRIFPSSFDIFRYFRFDSTAISLIASYCKSALKKNVISSHDIFENLSGEEEWEFLTFIFDECILKSEQNIFRSVSKGLFRRINYGHLKNAEGRQNIHWFLEALIRIKNNDETHESIHLTI